MRTLRKISYKGDEAVAEWDPKTVSIARLAEIEAEFQALQADGYFAADLTDGKNTLVDRFNPNADILMIPRVAGGRG